MPFGPHLLIIKDFKSTQPLIILFRFRDDHWWESQMDSATPAPEDVVTRLRRTAAQLRALAQRHAAANNAPITVKLNQVVAEIEANADALERVGDSACACSTTVHPEAPTGVLGT